MNNLEIIGKMIDYIFDIRVFDLLYHIAIIAVCGVSGYIVAMILIGLPVSLWEHFSKRKAPREKENKVIAIVAVCLAVAMFLRIIYEKVT